MTTTPPDLDDTRTLAEVVRENTRAELARRNLSGLDAAHRMGLSKTTVYRLLTEKDPSPFRLKDIDQFASMLGVSTDVLTARSHVS